VPSASFFELTRSGNYSRLVDALLREADFRRGEYSVDAWNTIYVGGGTPSMLSPSEIGTLAVALASRRASPSAEFTVEANPEDVTGEWLAACADAGVNRLSLGIQSMSDATLAGVHRRGNAESNRRALGLAKLEWKGRLSVDLIAGLPGQTAKSLIDDIDRVTEFGPDHVSLYSLTIEDGTPLGQIVAGKAAPFAGFIPLPDDDEAADMWIAGRDRLERLGYAQYEVSNFALPRCESAHNATYWELGSWLGAGPGSVGTIARGDAATRVSDPDDIAQWLEKPETSRSIETITRDDCVKEAILMGMRTTKGIDRSRFASRFGVDPLDLIPSTSSRWVDRGLLLRDAERVALNREGLLFLNSFLASCMEELGD
jgi:oxygen-independent coproporphyrinogen III oxidase